MKYLVFTAWKDTYPKINKRKILIKEAAQKFFLGNILNRFKKGLHLLKNEGKGLKELKTKIDKRCKRNIISLLKENMII